MVMYFNYTGVEIAGISTLFQHNILRATISEDEFDTIVEMR